MTIWKGTRKRRSTPRKKPKQEDANMNKTTKKMTQQIKIPFIKLLTNNNDKTPKLFENARDSNASCYHH